MANAAVGGDGTAKTAGSLTLRGDIAASPGNAGHRLTKLGPATLVLAGSGTDYKGGTDIEAGIVRAERARALGGGSVDVKPGATLLLAGVTLELSEPTSTLKLAGSGSDGRLGALHATVGRCTLPGRRPMVERSCSAGRRSSVFPLPTRG